MREAKKNAERDPHTNATPSSNGVVHAPTPCDLQHHRRKQRPREPIERVERQTSYEVRTGDAWAAAHHLLRRGNERERRRDRTNDDREAAGFVACHARCWQGLHGTNLGLAGTIRQESLSRARLPLPSLATERRAATLISPAPDPAESRRHLV